ncbi:uncharacterized protein N7473_005684 [Penicillium subrubescens]|uniref:uncharacterized protein n=1 Tax=Penicillium subrubescens TaxID=1316194 RepID=UPI0025450B0D|nr:uncharacterized protein N7473_005684 [Penicillium subrubescens]KAJ5896285.1 hypothetical protein N7473_005684 [Penicillium subrubescens]
MDFCVKTRAKRRAGREEERMKTVSEVDNIPSLSSRDHLYRTKTELLYRNQPLKKNLCRKYETYRPIDVPMYAPKRQRDMQQEDNAEGETEY